ncbi:MAG: hypothetical protein HY558_02795 [Euryarchaeota archaeon]|nr:hypothetical protein [Euryarchaeota archaeon]
MVDLLGFLESGPKTTEEVVTSLRKTGVAEMTIHRNLRKLARDGQILRLPILDGERWTSLYALPRHKREAVTLSGFIPLKYEYKTLFGVISGAIERLQERLLRNPTVDEVLLDVHENPESPRLREAVYKIGSGIGWHPPGPAEVREARVRQDKLLRLARSLRKGGGLSRLADPREVEEAQRYAQKYPEAVK